MLILGQKSCFLGPTIFKIPQLTLPFTSKVLQVLTDSCSSHADNLLNYIYWLLKYQFEYQQLIGQYNSPREMITHKECTPANTFNVCMSKHWKFQ